MAPPQVTPSPHRFARPPPTATKAQETPVSRPKAGVAHVSAPTKQSSRFVIDQDLVQRPLGAQFKSTSSFSHARTSAAKRPRYEEPEHFATPRRFVVEPAKHDAPTDDDGDDEDEAQPQDCNSGGDEMLMQPSVEPRKPSFLAPYSAPAHTPVGDGVEPLSPTRNTRPVFLQPSSSPARRAEPLPEAFSPHRRGQKFVPGGMASEVRQWILDTSHLSNHSRRLGHGDSELRAEVTHLSGSTSDGMMLVKARLSDGKEISAVLPGGGKYNSAELLRAGEWVGLRRPMWEVEIGGRQWVVTPDWRMTSEDG